MERKNLVKLAALVLVIGAGFLLDGRWAQLGIYALICAALLLVVAVARRPS